MGGTVGKQRRCIKLCLSVATILNYRAAVRQRCKIYVFVLARHLVLSKFLGRFQSNKTGKILRRNMYWKIYELLARNILPWERDKENNAESPTRFYHRHQLIRVDTGTFHINSVGKREDGII